MDEGGWIWGAFHIPGKDQSEVAADGKFVRAEAYGRSRNRCKKIETLFGEVKHNLALTRLRLRGLAGARDEFLLTATVQNLKRLAKMGLPAIDLAHQTLFQAAKMLGETVLGDKAYGSIRVDLRRLLEITQRHFGIEEGLFEESNYPGADEHRQLHKELLEIMRNIVQRYEIVPKSINKPNLLELLEKSLILHITSQDMEFARFLERVTRQA